MGFLVSILTRPSFSSSLKNHFTILSSREWKVITAILPPFLATLSASLKAGLILSSSPLTSILSAWNVRVAGWILPCLYCPGTADAITSARSEESSNGFSLPGDAP